MNRLRRLSDLGQSVFLDEISRSLIHDELDALIEEDGLHGVTSNPVIFDQAIAGSDDYDDFIRQLAAQGADASQAYERVAIRDIQDAADKFRSLYDTSDGQHGYVSLEVSPELAYHTAGTLDEARRLWNDVDRPNVFIKVPGTKAGLPAISQLISEGVNVNVTLLFSLPRYQAVAESYLAGLEKRLEAGKPISRVSSVASFFLSRIDSMIDPLLDAIAQQEGAKAELARSLRGEAAISSAKQAFRMYRALYSAPRFRALQAQGARPQRLLWASTGTKDPHYSDVKYVEPLIGPDTINTMPKATLAAYRHHGNPDLRLEEGLERASEGLDRLGELGIDLEEITDRLESEGVKKFVEPFRSLLDTLRQALARTPA